LRGYAGALAGARAVEPNVVIDELVAANPSRRVGRPEEFGAVCAFYASVHAGYITGQNLLLDGGAYPGTF
jgi:3-oxoacyl-[acyl-carrier protein] reductase